MSETNEGAPLDLYEYFRSLSVEELESHMTGLTSRVELVKSHYTGPIGRYRKKLKEEDMSELNQVFGDLLPMTMNVGLQNQAVEGRDVLPQDLLLHRVTGMTMDIMMFMARFNNTGVEVLWSQAPIF